MPADAAAPEHVIRPPPGITTLFGDFLQIFNRAGTADQPPLLFCLSFLLLEQDVGLFWDAAIKLVVEATIGADPQRGLMTRKTDRANANGNVRHQARTFFFLAFQAPLPLVIWHAVAFTVASTIQYDGHIARRTQRTANLLQMQAQ